MKIEEFAETCLRLQRIAIANEAPDLEAVSESLMKTVHGTNLGLSDGGS